MSGARKQARPLTTPALLAGAKRVVLKVGSVLVADSKTGKARQDWINALAQDVTSLLAQGKEVLVVTSGGIALGRNAMGIGGNVAPASIRLEQKQAASAVGQFHLFHSYFLAFSAQDTTAAQVLLTMSETENRRMHLNARATLLALMERGIVPIINENDTVSTGEIRFGDNDRLAVRVAQMVDADAVILFSTVDGLYTADPTIDLSALHIPLVEEISPQHEAMAAEAVPGLSTGGMKSKIAAAVSATRSGVSLVITDGRADHAVASVFADQEKRSTLFLAKESRTSARKKWLRAHLHARGTIVLDEGAAKALKEGRSLLPIGVRAVEGNFQRGDAVRIKGPDGKELAMGLSAYSAEDARRIMGRKSQEIEAILGYAGRNELVHRDDMAVD